MTARPSGLASPTREAGDVEIVTRSYDDPDATRLLTSFYRDQVTRYGFAESIDLDPTQFTDPRGVFVVAYQQGEPIGCGGYRWCDRATGTVEIKKTYVVANLRGHGVGRAVLVWLEEHATEAGARWAILETGVRNTVALALFAGRGYRPIARYVPGRDPEINRAFAKPLTSSDQPLHRKVPPATLR